MEPSGRTTGLSCGATTITTTTKARKNAGRTTNLKSYKQDYKKCKKSYKKPKENYKK